MDLPSLIGKYTPEHLAKCISIFIKNYFPRKGYTTIEYEPLAEVLDKYGEDRIASFKIYEDSNSYSNIMHQLCEIKWIRSFLRKYCLETQLFDLQDSNGVRSTSYRVRWLAECPLSSEVLEKRKISQVVLTVLFMLFGDIPEEILERLIKSEDAYSLAMEKCGDILRQDCANFFTNNQEDESIVSSHLIQDGSNKKDKDLVLRFATSQLKNGEIKTIALEPDLNVTKKSAINTEQTRESTEKFTDLGQAKIKGGTTDGFSAATKELLELLEAFDACAKRLSWQQGGCPLLKYYSRTVNGVMYHHDGKFRKYRHFYCVMHSLERFLHPFLQSFTQGQGLDYVYAVGQSLYRISYVMEKFANEITKFHSIALGGVEFLKTELRELRRILKEGCMTRWVTIERAADQLVRLLQFPATQQILDLFREQYPDAEHILKLYPCIGSEEPSYFCLMFHWLFDHSTKLGDECLQILGFLACPFARICVLVLASMYSHHLLWAGFADSKGTNTVSLSTRMKDIPIFFRNLLEFLADLEKDWRRALGQYSPYIDRECERSENTIDSQFINVNRTSCLKFFEKRLKEEVIPEMKKKAKEYYIDVLTSLGFSVLGLLDPYLAPNCADSYLRILQNHVNPSQFVREIQGPPEAFTVYSSMEAFPGVTYVEYGNAILNNFKNCPDTIDILKSLGFYESPVIMQELERIRDGRLLQILQESESEWYPGTLVSKYWSKFMKEFPAIADSLSFNFDHMTVTSVVSEQAFSCCNFLMTSNDSREYIQSKFLFYENFTGDIVRKMRLNYGSKLCNNKKSLFYFMKEFHAKIAAILTKGYPVPSKREIRQDGLKTKELINLFPYIEMEVEANATAPGKRLTSSQVAESMNNFAYALISGKPKKIPNKKEDIIPKYVRNWKKEEWVQYLIKEWNYLPNQVPNRKTKKVQKELEQKLEQKPTENLKILLETPRTHIDV